MADSPAFATLFNAPAGASPATIATTGIKVPGAERDGAADLEPQYVGTRNTQAIVLNPTGMGSIVRTFAQLSGSDEVWYDPTSHNFFGTGVDAAGRRVFDVISDTSGLLLQSVLLPVSSLSNPHPIAVDPLTGATCSCLLPATRRPSEATRPEHRVAWRYSRPRSPNRASCR